MEGGEEQEAEEQSQGTWWQSFPADSQEDQDQTHVPLSHTVLLADSDHRFTPRGRELPELGLCVHTDSARYGSGEGKGQLSPCPPPW